jgi:hypothetical protein
MVRGGAPAPVVCGGAPTPVDRVAASWYSVAVAFVQLPLGSVSPASWSWWRSMSNGGDLAVTDEDVHRRACCTWRRSLPQPGKTTVEFAEATHGEPTTAGEEDR